LGIEVAVFALFSYIFGACTPVIEILLFVSVYGVAGGKGGRLLIKNLLI